MTGKLLTHRGETLTLNEWSERTGLPYKVIYARLRLGWNAERIFATPPKRLKMVTVGGETRTVAELARATGVRRTTLYARLKRGVGEADLTAHDPTPSRNPFAGSKKLRDWLFAWIIWYKMTNDGVAPSLKEMQEASQAHADFKGVSVGSIKWALTELRQQGKIAIVHNQPRCIKVTHGEWRYAPDGRV